MQALASKLPELMGGSADLDPSTFTWLKGQGDFAPASQPQEGVQGAVEASGASPGATCTLASASTRWARS
jgi:transketolase